MMENKLKSINGFSFLELNIAMMLIVVVIFVATPLLTRNTKKSGSAYGEFICYTMFDKTSKQYKLYQRQRYNTDTLSSAVAVSNCTFNRPAGVEKYNITVVGGGGGGARAKINTNIVKTINKIVDIDTTNGNPITITSLSKLPAFLRSKLINCNGLKCYHTTAKTWVSSYSSKKFQRKIDVYNATPGEKGEVFSFTSSLNEDFTNGQMKIYKCKNENLINGNSYEHNYCVGDGGLAKNEDNLFREYALNAILDYIHKTKFSSMPYVGNGDDAYNKFDVSLIASGVKEFTGNCLAILTSATTSSAYNSNVISCLESAYKPRFTMKTTERITGRAGGYSRFFVKENNMNVLAKGGTGGVSGVEKDYMQNSTKYRLIKGSTTYQIHTGETSENQFDNRFPPLASNIKTTCKILNGKLSCTPYDGDNYGVGGSAGVTYVAYDSNRSPFIVYNNYYSGNGYYNLNDVYSDKYLYSDFDVYSSLAGNGGGGAIIISW